VKFGLEGGIFHLPKITDDFDLPPSEAANPSRFQIEFIPKMSKLENLDRA